MIMAAGSGAPADARRAIAEDGNKVIHALLSAKNKIMSSLTVFGFVFSSCKSLIALSPNGVAALARPRKFEVKLIEMDVKARCPFGIFGKRRRKNGLINRAIPFISPASSAIRLMPNHRAIIAIRLILDMIAFSA